MQFSPLTAADLPYLREFEPPGWGDLVPRFDYCIRSFFCAPIKLTVNNKMVAIGTPIFHKDSAWLASIIVHPEHRIKGYGNAITQKLVDSIDTKRYTTIYLDATDLGFPVYQKIGFQLEATYTHLKAPENITGLQLSSSIIPYEEKYLLAILALDRQVSCEDRYDSIIENLATAKVYVEGGDLQGYYLPSLGNGLIIAKNDIAGIELTKYRLENNFYAILPAANSSTISFLEKTGLQQFRLSRRMFIGKKRPWQAERMYHRISGQLG